MLQVESLSKSYGSNRVLDGVTFSLSPGEHVALIGSNGSGKSTLVRCIAGVESPDAGRVVVPAATTIGYLPQHCVDNSRPVETTIEAAGARLRIAESKLAEAAAALARGDDRSEDAYVEALSEYGALSQTANRHDADGILAGLGLAELHRSRTVESLSGGEQTRLALALMLVASPNLLLLDEPTNHLDLAAIKWLELFVRGFKGAALIVSHDREFLDRTVSRALFLEPKTRRVRSYPGGYTAFAEARRREREDHEAAWRLQQGYERQVEQDIRRLKEGARHIELSTTPRQPGVRVLAKKKARLAKSRERKLERYRSSDERVEKPKREWWLAVDFGTAADGARWSVALEDVSFAYPDGPPLLQHSSLDVAHGEHIALTGPNGAGKSTLLRLVAGELEPVEGRLRLGSGVIAGYLAQGRRTLDPAWTVLDAARRFTEQDETAVRAFLHLFLFEDDEPLKRVSDLSLGQQVRLELGCLVLQGCSLLLLDEPVNHLDVDSREHLEAALAKFTGTVIAVSHDRAFTRAFADRVLELRDGRLLEAAIP